MTDSKETDIEHKTAKEQNEKQPIDLPLARTSEDPENLEVSAPEAYGYKFHSHGVVEMLQKLHDKFVDERTALEKEEMSSKHAHEMLVQDLTAQTDQATQALTTKKVDLEGTQKKLVATLAYFDKL